MKPTDKIDFQNVGELTRRLTAQKITPPRFSLDIPVRDAANGIYSAMRAEVANRRHELIFDDATKSHIEQAAQWLIDSTGKPGLLLMGLCGNGKTTMMRAIGRLIEYVSDATLGYSRRLRMELCPAKELATAYVSAVSDTKNSKAYKDFKKEYITQELLGIDDLGVDPKEVMAFGCIYTPLIDIISERYDRQLPTIITTNLTPEQLSAKYDPRIYDRLKEMAQIITFTNPSYRK